MVCPSRTAAVLGLLLVRALPLAAQEPFAQVQQLLQPGDVVFLTDSTGAETRGRVASVGPSTLRLKVNGVEREWAAPAITQVTRRGDSLANGALIGMAVGGAVGAVGGYALGSLLRYEGHDAVGPFFVLIGVGAGGGAAIGAGFDALGTGETLIYRRESRVAFVPTVTRQLRAVQLSIRF